MESWVRKGGRRLSSGMVGGRGGAGIRRPERERPVLIPRLTGIEDESWSVGWEPPARRVDGCGGLIVWPLVGTHRTSGSLLRRRRSWSSAVEF